MNAPFPKEVEDGERRFPDPLPLIGTVADAQPFPLDALGNWMRGAVEAISHMAFVPPSMAAASVLSAASLALQGHADVKLPTGMFRPISLFMVTIAETGDRKSASDERAMEAVAEFQRELTAEYADEKAKLAAALEAWTETKKLVVAEHKKSGRDALQAALDELGPRPSEPMDPVMIARGGSTQGLVKLMERGRPSMGLMSDEGGSWLGGYGMSEEGRLHTISTLSDFWDGKPVQRLTSGEGSSLVYGRRLAFHLMIQPVIAGQLFGDPLSKGQGFLSRILPTQPPSLAGSRFITAGSIVDQADEIKLAAFNERMSRILRAKLPFDKDKNALVLDHVWIDREAEALWVDFYNECERRVGRGGELEEVRGFVGKLAEQAARLAAILLLFERGTSDKKITADIMARAILLARFYLSEAVRLIGLAPADPVILEAQALAEWLSTTWNENLISIRAICTFGPRQFRKLGGDQLRDILEALARNYHLVKLPNGGTVRGKRAPEAWRIMNREERPE